MSQQPVYQRQAARPGGFGRHLRQVETAWGIWVHTLRGTCTTRRLATFGVAALAAAGAVTIVSSDQANAATAEDVARAQATLARAQATLVQLQTQQAPPVAQAAAAPPAGGPVSATAAAPGVVLAAAPAPMPEIPIDDVLAAPEEVVPDEVKENIRQLQRPYAKIYRRGGSPANGAEVTWDPSSGTFGGKGTFEVIGPPDGWEGGFLSGTTPEDVAPGSAYGNVNGNWAAVPLLASGSFATGGEGPGNFALGLGPSLSGDVGAEGGYVFSQDQYGRPDLTLNARAKVFAEQRLQGVYANRGGSGEGGGDSSLYFDPTLSVAPEGRVDVIKRIATGDPRTSYFVGGGVNIDVPQWQYSPDGRGGRTTGDSITFNPGAQFGATFGLGKDEEGGSLTPAVTWSQNDGVEIPVTWDPAGDFPPIYVKASTGIGRPGDNKNLLFTAGVGSPADGPSFPSLSPGGSVAPEFLVDDSIGLDPENLAGLMNEVADVPAVAAAASGQPVAAASTGAPADTANMFADPQTGAVYWVDPATGQTYLVQPGKVETATV